jgi:phosphoglycerol transferase MdoB-like AlkP superfamily enzyme
MKKSKASIVFSVFEVLIAIAALTFFILLLITSVGMGYVISSLSGQFGQTLYIVTVVATVAIFVGAVILILTTRDIIRKKRK